MDASRLQLVIMTVMDEFEAIKLPEHIKLVAASLDNLVKTPSAESEAAYQEAVTNLKNMIALSSFPDMVESSRQILEAIGGADLVGDGLVAKVNSILESRLLPSQAHQEFNGLATKMNKFLATIKDAENQLSTLGIKHTTLESQEYELGVLIPESVHGNSFQEINEELKIWYQILKNFNEVLGRGPDLRVRSIETGSLEFFFLN